MSTIKDIGNFLSKALPQVGGLAANVLTGNIPGAIGEVMDWISGATGSADPGEILSRLQADPAALAATQQAILANQGRLKELDTQVTLAGIQQDVDALREVNATMQSEGKSEHWMQYSWRPAIGFAFAAAFFAVAVLCCWLAYTAVSGTNPEAISMIPLLIGAFVPLFGVPAAILGVAAWHRGVMKVEQVKAEV